MPALVSWVSILIAWIINQSHYELRADRSTGSIYSECITHLMSFLQSIQQCNKLHTDLKQRKERFNNKQPTENKYPAITKLPISAQRTTLKLKSAKRKTLT